MRRGVAQYLVGSVVLVSLAGCGTFVYERRAAWRDEAEQACLARKSVTVSAYVEPAREISGPGSCGMLQPFRLTALAEGSVGLTSRATLACPMAAQLDRWVTEVVQPAAQLSFGTSVQLLRAGSYSCRGVNNRQGGPKSEHSFGNAVDVMGFRLADGRDVSVERGWRGTPQEQEFLREIFVASCRMFTTVLGPGSDMLHYNHFHLDLARHSGRRHVCKPVIKYAPRLEAFLQAGGALSPRPAAEMPSQPVLPARPATAMGRPLVLDFPDAGASTPVDGEAEMDDPVDAPITPETDPFALKPASRRP